MSTVIFVDTAAGDAKRRKVDQPVKNPRLRGIDEDTTDYLAYNKPFSENSLFNDNEPGKQVDTGDTIKKIMSNVDSDAAQTVCEWIDNNQNIYQVTAHHGTSSCTFAALINWAFLMGLQGHFKEYSESPKLSKREFIVKPYEGEMKYECEGGDIQIDSDRQENEPPVQNWEAYFFGELWCFRENKKMPIYSLNETKAILEKVVPTFCQRCDIYNVKPFFNIAIDGRLLKPAEKKGRCPRLEQLVGGEDSINSADVACNAAAIIENELDEGRCVAVGLPQHAVTVFGYNDDNLFAVGSSQHSSLVYTDPRFSYENYFHVIPREWAYFYLTSFAIKQ